MKATVNYRGYQVERHPHLDGYLSTHEDYDGAPDSGPNDNGDPRCFHSTCLELAIEDINDQIIEFEDRGYYGMRVG